MKYSKHLALAFISISLAGCLKDKEIDNAESKIRSTMKDPESTKFESVKNYGNGVICGNYNSKNSYGAYTGYKGFILTKDDLLTQAPKIAQTELDNNCQVISSRANKNEQELRATVKECEKQLDAIRNAYVSDVDYKDIHTDTHKRKRELFDTLVLMKCGVTKYKAYYSAVEEAEELATQMRFNGALYFISDEISKIKSIAN